MESVNGMLGGSARSMLMCKHRKDFPSPNIVSHYHRLCTSSPHQLYTHSTTFSRPPTQRERKTFLRWCSCAFFPPAHTRNINKNRFAAVLQELSLRLDVLCSGRRTRVVLTCKRFSDSLLHSTYWLSRRRRLRKIGELDNRGGENFTMRKFFESFSARESSKFLLTARRNVKSVKICK